MRRNLMRIFESTLTKPTRYYASSAYRTLLTKDTTQVRVVITGQKHDVTDEIEAIIQRRIAEDRIDQGAEQEETK